MFYNGFQKKLTDNKAGKITAFCKAQKLHPIRW